MRKMILSTTVALAFAGSAAFAGESMTGNGEVDLAKTRVTNQGTLEVAYEGGADERSSGEGIKAVFKAVDQDGDEVISEFEAQLLNGLASIFNRLDQDGSRSLELSEFSRLSVGPMKDSRTG